MWPPVLWASGEDCQTGRGGCPLSWGTSASPPLARVCSVRWKPSLSNWRGPIRAWRARQFKRALQPGLRLPPPRHPRRPAPGRVNLLPRLLWSNTDARVTGPRPAGAGQPWSTPCTASPSGAGERTRACPSTSPPLVSARCSRLPGLLHPALSAPKEHPMVMGEAGSRRSFPLGAPSLPPSSCGCPGGAQAQAQAWQAAGHHLLPGHWCQVHLVLPHLAGIITPQLIFQRPRLSPLSFPLESSSGFNQGLVTTSPGSSAGSAQVAPCGLTLEATV